MSPTTPVTFASPTKPASWSWEATSESVAERYGIPVEQVVRFDQNTAPAPPARARELLAAGRWVVALSEYPPSDYRRLLEAAAARYGVTFEELLVGAGADEILDLSAKAFLPAGGAAIVPSPTYPMYGILTDQRRRPSCGYRADRPATGTPSTWMASGPPRPNGQTTARCRGSSGSAARTTRPAGPSLPASSPRCSTACGETPTRPGATHRP